MISGKSGRFSLGRVSVALAVPFLVAFATGSSLAQSSVSLTINLTDKGRAFSAIISGTPQDPGCQTLLYASAKKKVLKNRIARARLVSASAGPDAVINAVQVKPLRSIKSITGSSRRIRALRAAAKNREKAFFAASLECPGSASVVSDIKSLRLARRGSRGPRNVEGWIKVLARKAGNLNVALEPVFNGLSFANPVDLQSSPDRSGRLFVVEQGGVIRSFENRNDVTATVTLLDIQDRVLSGGERGLLGMAFHPQFKDNGFIFVNYTAKNDGRTVVSRFTVSGGAAGQANPATEFVLLTVPQPYSNHNGGQIAFGPDGFLYIGMGDGGSGGDPDGNGQNLTTLLGDLLRIDVNSTSPGLNYSIPAGNPYVGNSSGFREEIYASGFRNPWRFSFDSAGSDLWLADVGQGALEEVNLVVRGGNYGWKIKEGTQCFSPPSGCSSTGLIDPVTQYDHSQGRSITGGYVYRGSSLPGLTGFYLYGDFITGRIWAVKKSGAEVLNKELLDTSFAISTFGVDDQKELYLCDYSSGKIHKFVPGA